MSHQDDTSPLTLNRISVYLRCLRHLQDRGVSRISSQQLARRFHLSASQIRKDLAQFGEFGIRGVGYDVGHLRERLERLLGIGRQHPAVIVGAGNIGTRWPDFRASARVASGFWRYSTTTRPKSAPSSRGWSSATAARWPGAWLRPEPRSPS